MLLVFLLVFFRTLIEVKGRALLLEVPDRMLAERVWYDVLEDRDGGRLPAILLA